MDFSIIEDLEPWLESIGSSRPFLIADENASKKSGATRRIAPILERYDFEVFSDFEPNPNSRDLVRGYAALQGSGGDCVVAIGGGTAIDLAKLICLAVAQDEQREIGKLLVASPASKLNARKIPLAVVPTTAGTGSEATQFAVLYVNQVKFSVSHPSLLPDRTILDPKLTESLPPSITAATGLDALSQSIESMWSVRSTEQSLELAGRSLRIGLDHLERAVNDPSLVHRQGMMEAAHLAGQAINISRTTAAHALSYHLTIEHGIPHGEAVALSIGPCIRFNGEVASYNVSDPRGVSHVSRMMTKIANSFGVPSGADAMEILAERWEQLLKRIGCRTRLSEFDITATMDLQEIVNAVNQDRLANNPRRINDRELTQLVASFA